jgi:hypothetical protein
MKRADSAVTDTSGPAWGPRATGCAALTLPLETGVAPSFARHAPSLAVSVRRGKPRLHRKTGATSESHEDRLRLQQNAPRFLHAALNFIFQPDNIARFRVSAVDQRQRVLVRDPYRSGGISFGRSPSVPPATPPKLCVAHRERDSWESRALSMRRGGQVFELRFAEHWILEERSGAAAIGVSGNNQHAFASPYFAHRRAGFGERRRRLFFRRAFGKCFCKSAYFRLGAPPRFNR